MNKPLPFYLQRNAKIVNDFAFRGMAVFELCEKYALKEQRIKQILRAAGMSTMVVKDGPKTPAQILRSLKLSKESVRSSLARFEY